MPTSNPSVQPRILRAGQAPAYLGMCRDEFNKTVRPNVNEFPIGKRGVGFDRLELDEWADAYITNHLIEKQKPIAVREWVAQGRTVTGLSPKISDSHAKSKEDFQKALAMVMGKTGPKGHGRSEG